MSKEIIKRHNFETAKKKIQTFTKKIPDSIYLPKFEEDGGLFRLGDHKVTGEEMNIFLTRLQQEFMNFNSSISNIFKQFKEIYVAFDSLDKDYISGILAAIGSAAESSKQARAASDKANLACGDIKKTIAVLQTTIDKLKEFKSNSQNKITRIDNEINKLSFAISDLELKQNSTNLESVRKELDQAQAEIASLQQYKEKLEGITEATTNFTNFKSEIDKVIQELNTRVITFETFQDDLKKYIHLCDIDDIWDDVQNHRNQIDKADKKLSSYIESTSTDFGKYKSEQEKRLKDVHDIQDKSDANIKSLNEYRSKLQSIEHILDIDKIWQDLNQQRTDIDNAGKLFSEHVTNFSSYKLEILAVQNRVEKNLIQLNSFQKKLEGYKHTFQIDELWDFSHVLSTQTETLTNRVDAEIQRIDSAISGERQRIKNRLTILYVIGGTAVALAITHLVLSIAGVL